MATRRRWPIQTRPGDGTVTWQDTVTNQDDPIVFDQPAITLVGPGD